VRIDLGQHVGAAHGGFDRSDAVAQLLEAIGQLTTQVAGPDFAGEWVLQPLEPNFWDTALSASRRLRIGVSATGMSIVTRSTPSPPSNVRAAANNASTSGRPALGTLDQSTGVPFASSMNWA